MGAKREAKLRRKRSLRHRLGRWAAIRSPRDLLLRIGKDLRPFVNGVIGRGSMIGDPPVFDAAALEWTRELEASWQLVQKEAEQILALRRELPSLVDLSPDHRRIAGGPGWRSYFLYGYGQRREDACRRCPETARMLDRVPGLQSAFFSIMQPGQYLKRHTGPTKAIITWHLPLFVPDHAEDCQIVIDGTPYAWEPGRSLIFDDTYEHEVWNMTNQERVVLLMHVRRPVRGWGAWLARLFLGAIKLSPFVRDARRRQDEWERAFERAQGRIQP